MNNIPLSVIILSILKKMIFCQDQISILEDKPFSNAEIKAIEDNSYDSDHYLTTDEKKKIIGYLNSANIGKKKPTKLIEDPTGYCRSFRTCFDCSKSIWYPCGWCHNYGCTDQPEKLCTFAMSKFDLVDTNTTDDLAPVCPYIEHRGSILIPAGVRQNIHVKLHTSDPVLYEKELICQLQFSNRLTHLKALILNDVVYCYPVTLDTVDQGETNVGTMRLIWGGVQPFSNKIPVSVYRCDVLAVDCESCRVLPPEYGCGWCSDENVCVVADKCSDHLKWNVNRLTCKSLGKKMFYV